jgi:hypothetical protein
MSCKNVSDIKNVCSFLCDGKNGTDEGKKLTFLAAIHYCDISGDKKVTTIVV